MATELKPTSWRTARALANSDRLHLMQLVSAAMGARGVSELAAAADIPIPTASIYLRALNARGLVNVVRVGPYVYYGTGSDRSLPVAASIQKSFASLFARKDLPDDWTARLLPLLRAYSSPRREAIVRTLVKARSIRYDEFRRLSGMCTTTFLRNLGKLLDAGIVVRDTEGFYSLAKPQNSLAAAFLAACQS